MVGRIGLQGEIRSFELWDWFTARRVSGHFFVAVAEMIDGNWLSVCEKCHNFRCLKIDIQKQTYACQECNFSGTFKKPEEPMKKKSRESNSKKVRKSLPEGKKKE